MILDTCMENRLRQLAGILTFLILSIILTGCYKETYDDCPSGRWIYFQSVMAKYNYSEIVESADLYLYDTQGQLVHTYVYVLSEVKANGGKLLLPFQDTGDYTLVAVINNSKDHYEVTGAEHTTSGRLSVLCDDNSIVNRMTCDIYHAYKTIAFDRYSITREETDILDLYKNTNDFTIDIQYTGNSTPTGIVDMNISAVNGTYGYDNKLSSDGMRYYKPYAYLEEESRYLIRTMRFQTDTDILLNLELWTDDYEINTPPNTRNNSDESEILRSHHLNITEFLSEIKDSKGNYLYDTDEKLEQEDHFHIVITLKPNFDVAGITVNNWFAIRPEEEL